jgi:prolyl 4-hydroxylase
MADLHPTLAHAFQLSAAGRNPEAMLIVHQLAAQGDPEALWILGDANWRGNRMPVNYVRGRELIGRASDAGHPIATRAFTNLLASGIAGPRDWQRALSRLAQEARSDRVRARMLSLIRHMDLNRHGDPRKPPRGQVLSESPHVMLFPRLFSPAECDYLADVAEPTYAPSLVGGSDTRDDRDPVRSSDGSTLHWLIEDPAIHALNRRLAAASGTAYDWGESPQILRYAPGQQYRNHLDYLPGADNQRIMTALVYLNTGYEGGETAFVKTELRIKGAKGDCIVFRNALADGRPDPMSEHAGLPVTRGTKYLASRWIRERRHII